LKNLYTAAFYAPVLPFGLIWTLGGNIAVYWVHKFTLLRRSKRDRALSAVLPIEMTEQLEFVLIIYGVSTLAFDFLFSGNIGYISISLLALAVINAALPMQLINDKIFGEVKEKVTEEDYQSQRLDFDEDYDRVNPALKEDALKKYEQEAEARSHAVAAESKKDR